jgi:hypothetical protein
MPNQLHHNHESEDMAMIELNRQSNTDIVREETERVEEDQSSRINNSSISTDDIEEEK